MPRIPDWIKPLGVELESTSGRFNTRPAVAIGTGEAGDDHPSAEDVVRENFGGWLLEEHPELGRAEARDGSAGRGAEGWVAVVQWLGQAIANGVVDLAIAAAFVKVLRQLRDWRDGRQADNKPASLEISRGAAAMVAAAHVSEEYGESGTLVVEAVEEPSTIAGHDITELSYVGVEPWIVLLRNDAGRTRYVVVVMPDGVVSGALRIPFLPFEDLFLGSSQFGDQA